jgi:uncharacterized protein (TIGR00297 family)
MSGQLGSEDTASLQLKSRSSLLKAYTSEFPRKMTHVAMLGFAFSLRYLSPMQTLLCASAACLFNLYCLPRIGRQLLRQSERNPFSSGPFCYSLSVLILTLIFFRYLHIVAAAWAVMALGDGAASWRRSPPRFAIPWNREKSVLGSVRFIVFGSFGATALLAWVLRFSSQTRFSLAELFAVSVTATVCCAVIESLPWRLNDNLTVPLAGGLLFFLMLHTPMTSVLRSHSFKYDLLMGFLANLILGFAAWLLGWVRGAGAVAGGILGSVIFAFLGWRGLILLLTFLILGSLSTKLGYHSKNQLGISQRHHGARGAKEALANVALPALLAVLASVGPTGALFLIGFVSALAAATSDTVSSELGQWLGGRPYLITNFSRVRPGTNGAITLAGTVLGIGAASLLGLIALCTQLISLSQFWIVQIAGLAGNLADSFLGASLEGANGIDNETVNFLNTLVGACTGMALEWGIHLKA